jgi:hypothetical protein
MVDRYMALAAAGSRDHGYLSSAGIGARAPLA